MTKRHGKWPGPKTPLHAESMRAVPVFFCPLMSAKKLGQKLSRGSKHSFFWRGSYASLPGALKSRVLNLNKSGQHISLSLPPEERFFCHAWKQGMVRKNNLTCLHFSFSELNFWMDESFFRSCDEKLFWATRERESCCFAFVYYSKWLANNSKSSLSLFSAKSNWVHMAGVGIIFANHARVSFPSLAQDFFREKNLEKKHTYVKLWLLADVYLDPRWTRLVSHH